MAKKKEEEKKEEKKIVVPRHNGSGLWTKYWAKHGTPVIHVDRLKIEPGKELKDYTMRVTKVIKTTVGEGEAKKQYTDGIECHWIDADMRLHKEIFNTRELIPFDIAKQGLEVVQEWYDRDYNEQ